MKLFAFVVLFSLLLFGCAVEQYRPVVDSAGSRGDYGADISECQLLSQRPAAATSGSGAVSGAILDAPRDAAVAQRESDVARVAARGAANDGSDGGASGVAWQQMIVARCMAGRGYNVVAQ